MLVTARQTGVVRHQMSPEDFVNGRQTFLRIRFSGAAPLFVSQGVEEVDETVVAVVLSSTAEPR